MRLYNTVADVVSETETLFKNLTGKPSFTAGDHDIVLSAIVDALQIVLLEYGVENFRFQEQDIEVSTVAGQNYVDLDEYVYRIMNGSVRIPARDINLAQIDEIAIYQFDPRDIETGEPTSWAYMNSGDPNIIRIRFYPTPNQVYVVKFKGLQLPTDVITNFPTHLMLPIKNKSKSLALLGLGLGNASLPFDTVYEKAIMQIKDGYESDGPKHVTRSYIVTPRRSIEGRIST